MTSRFFPPVLALGLICSFALIARAPASATLPNPCKILMKSDIQKVLHGKVSDARMTRLNRAPAPGSSTHCDYFGSNGNVIVVVHDNADEYPNPTNPLFKQMGMKMRPLAGVGVPALLIPGHTATFIKHGIYAQVELFGGEAVKNDTALVALARIAAGRIP